MQFDTTTPLAHTHTHTHTHTNTPNFFSLFSDGLYQLHRSQLFK